MRCLFVAASFPPAVGSGARRTVTICKYLPAETFVLTLAPGYLNYDEDIELNLPANVHVVGTRALYPRILNSEKGLRRFVKRALRQPFYWLGDPDFLRFWVPVAVRAGQKIIQEQGIDLIYTSSPKHSVQLIGKRLKDLTGLPWIAEFRDPLPHPESYSEGLPGGRNRFAERWAKRLLPSCDKLVGINRGVASSLKPYVPERRAEDFAVISHGYDPELWDGSEPPHSDVLHISYNGRFYPEIGQSPDLFLQALSRLIDDGLVDPHKIQVTFRGEMPKESQALIKKLKLSNCVTYQGRVPWHVSIQTLRESHLLLLIAGTSELARRTVTQGKVFEYMAVGRSVLALVPAESPAASIVEETQIGRIADPSRAEDIAQVLQEYYEEFVSAGKIAYRPNRAACAQYSWQKQALHLHALMQETIDAASTPHRYTDHR